MDIILMNGKTCNNLDRINEMKDIQRNNPTCAGCVQVDGTVDGLSNGEDTSGGSDTDEEYWNSSQGKSAHRDTQLKNLDSQRKMPANQGHHHHHPVEDRGHYDSGQGRFEQGVHVEDYGTANTQGKLSDNQRKAEDLRYNISFGDRLIDEGTGLEDGESTHKIAGNLRGNNRNRETLMEGDTRLDYGESFENTDQQMCKFNPLTASHLNKKDDENMSGSKLSAEGVEPVNGEHAQKNTDVQKSDPLVDIPCGETDDEEDISSNATEPIEQEMEENNSDSDQTEEFQKQGHGLVDGSGDESEVSQTKKDSARSIHDICGSLLQKAQNLSEGASCESDTVCGSSVNESAGEEWNIMPKESQTAGQNNTNSIGETVETKLEVFKISRRKKLKKKKLIKLQTQSLDFGIPEYNMDEPVDDLEEGTVTTPLKQYIERDDFTKDEFNIKDLNDDLTDEKKCRFLCAVCGKTFNSKSEVAKHKFEAHNSKPGMFRCEKCDLSFSRRSWQAHMKEEHSGPTMESQTETDNVVFIYPTMHKRPEDRKYSIGFDVTEPNPILECCFCSRKFHISGLHAHVKKAHPAWTLQYLCSSCGIQFKAIRNLTRHVRNKPNCVDSRCKSCNKSFIPVSAMINHKCEKLDPEIVEPGDLQCKKCGKCYKQKFHLLVHSAKCKKETIMTNECCICSRVFETLKGLEKHLKRHTAEEEEAVAIKQQTKTYRCNMCELTFFDLKEKNRHRTQVHRDHMCPICNEAFETKSKLGRHLVSHRTEKNYSCPLCTTQNRYRSEFCVRKHVRRCHADQFKELYGWDITIKSFICDICEKACLTRGDLVKHIRSHTNERPFHCKHCDSAFKQNRHLKEHMMYRHKEIYEQSYGPIEYKHKCDQCDKCFLQSCTLKKHLRAHARQQMLEMLKTPDGGTEVAQALIKPPRKRDRKKKRAEVKPVKVKEVKEVSERTKRRRRQKEKAARLKNISMNSIRPLAGVFVNHSLFPPDYESPSLSEGAPPPDWQPYQEGSTSDPMAAAMARMSREALLASSSKGEQESDVMAAHHGIIPPINGMLFTGQDLMPPSGVDFNEHVNRVSFSSISSLPVVEQKSTNKRKSQALDEASTPEISKKIKEEDGSSELDVIDYSMNASSDRNFNNKSEEKNTVSQIKYPDIPKIKPDPDACALDLSLNKRVYSENPGQTFEAVDDDDSVSSSSEEDTPDSSRLYLEMLEKGFDSDHLAEEKSNLDVVIKQEPIDPDEEDYQLS